ncbi:hypothetical protein M758_UG165000 [Ceratodon purpureus]|nr:hypothetical protein M758_UG165000 [Ceratodon purpureus]
MHSRAAEAMASSLSKVSTNMFATANNPATGESQYVTETLIASTARKVQSLCSHIADALIEELDIRFPANHVMDSLGIVFPQYWLQDNVDSSFSAHLSILKDFFATPKPCVNLERDGDWVPQLLSSADLDSQMAMFKMAMKSNSKGVLTPPFTVNPMTKLWQILGSNALLVYAFPEYFMVSKMAMTIVLGSVEDERAFSTIGFIKDKLRNKLGEHLPLCVQMFTQKFYTFKNFPYTEAVQTWRANKHRYCMNLQ